jgi:GTPase
MTETRIGKVLHYYTDLHVAGVLITDGELHEGDKIHIRGHTSDFMQEVESMELDHRRIDSAKAGDDIGIEVIEHARENDEVYLVH